MNNLLSYKGYNGSTEISIEDECLHGRILFIDDIITYEGNTIPELITSFYDAVDLYLEHCEKTGKPANKPYSGTFNIRIGENLHREAAQAARKKNITLNEYVTQTIKAAVEHNSVKKIEHTHTHTITIAPPSETRLSDVEQPSSWERIAYATTH